MALIPLNQLAQGHGSLAPAGVLGASAPEGPGLAGLIGSGASTAKSGAQTASWLAKLADQPGVSEWLGNLSGPLSLVGGVATGNPVSATTGAATTANMLSGELGGETLGSLLADLGVETAGGALGAGVTGGMLAVPTLIAMQLWQDGQNLAKQQAMAQGIERSTYAKEWPGLTGARTAGAGLLNLLPEINQAEDPQGIKTALGLATKGIRATDLAPGYENLTGDQGGKPNDLSQWAADAPALEGQNWASWLGLMDAANNAGIDAGQIEADSIGGPAQRPSVHHAFRSMLAGPKGDMTSDYLPSGHQANDITDYGASTINLLGGGEPLIPTGADNTPTAMRTYQPGTMKGGTTQEANDISNAIAGVGQQLGIDWGARGAENGPGGWHNQGYTILPEQLQAYGFTEGNYAPATLNYLKALDPTIADRPEWADYVGKMGVTTEQLAAQPQGLAALSGTPFFDPYGYVAPDYTKPPKTGLEALLGGTA